MRVRFELRRRDSGGYPRFARLRGATGGPFDKLRASSDRRYI